MKRKHSLGTRYTSTSSTHTSAAALALAATIALGAGATAARAGTAAWDGSTDANWATPTNWSNDLAPVTGDDLLFDATSPNTTTNNDLTALSVAGITFGPTAVAYTLNGN